MSTCNGRPQRARRGAVGLLALAVLLPPVAASAGEPAGRGGQRVRVDAAEPFPPPRPTRRLEQYGRARKIEARRRLDATNRAAERRVVENELRRSGDLADVAAFRLRIEREDDLDALRHRGRLARLRATGSRAGLERWWSSLGPETRRVLLRSGLDLERAAREQEQDARLDRLEAEIEAREEPGVAERFFRRAPH